MALIKNRILIIWALVKLGFPAWFQSLRIGRIVLPLIVALDYAKFIEQKRMILQMVLVRKNHFALIMQQIIEEEMKAAK